MSTNGNWILLWWNKIHAHWRKYLKLNVAISKNQNPYFFISFCIFQQSLWSEMIEELRFAIRCHGSTKKPALRRHCSKCTRYGPSDHCAVESPNGVVLKEIESSNHTMFNHRHTRETSFRYNIDDVNRDYRNYRDHMHSSPKLWYEWEKWQQYYVFFLSNMTWKWSKTIFLYN